MSAYTDLIESRRDAFIPAGFDATIVYIAGPYAGLVDTNVARASELSRFAVSLGIVPLCLHGSIQAGAYGDDDHPEERERGLERACDVAALVARSGGQIWVITRDDGTLSSGTERELAAWLRATRDTFTPPSIKTWAQWLHIMGRSE